MEAVFVKILNMGITAGWLVLALLVLRVFLKKAPKAIMVFMWGLVAIRLLCPVSLESAWSLIPSAETIPADILSSSAPTLHSGIPAINMAMNPALPASLTLDAGGSGNPVQAALFAAAIVWLAGMAAMLLYIFVSYLCIRRKACEAIWLKGRVWLCDRISAPFILGIFRPRILLPVSVGTEDMEYVVAHEDAHLKRHDHWWKPLGFLLLAVYWFHPLLWVAYALFCCDLELACDEKVIRDRGNESKKPYLDALINCSAAQKHKMIAGCPLAFAETGVERRIKSVLHYKKPTIWVILAAAAACIAVAAAFLTNPAAQRGGEEGAVAGKTVYGYKSSPDAIMPVFVLYADQTFEFTYSGLSSYLAFGTYGRTADTLTLRTGDGKDAYVFAADGDSYHFNAKKSSAIPEYRHSGDSPELNSPVPDGAVFERILEEASVEPSEFDAVYADIDGDGKRERCAMGIGPTSGIFTFRFSVREGEHMDSKLKYFNVFCSSFYRLSFEAGAGGKLYIRGEAQGKWGEETEVRFFEVRVEDGNIVLSDGDEAMEYWGEQGVDSVLVHPF